MRERTFYRLSIIAGLVLVVAVIGHVVLLSSFVSLRSAPALSGQIVQAAQTGSADSKLLVPGKDFSLQDVRYFDNGNWAFLKFNALNNNSNSGYAILQKKDGIFQVVGGPSSTLDSDYTYSIPLDMTTYLVQKGIID